MAESGRKYCPTCRAIRKTFVNKEMEDVEVLGIIAKQREILCDDCAGTWITVELLKSVIRESQE